MKNYIPRIIALATVSGLIAITPNITRAQTSDSLLDDSVDQSVFPQITVQPVDQTVPLGASIVLLVQANNADGYQWLKNGVSVDGQTNNSFTIASAGIGDVGLYACQVFNGSEMVPTRTANVCVYTTGSTPIATKSSSAKASAQAVTASAQVAQAAMPGGGPITVYGTPILSNGSGGGCPGKYAGYVMYTKSISQGWGWAPIAGMTHTATDTNRFDTKIQYFGAYGDTGCAQTTVTIPNPTYSPVYQFAVYFTNNVPTNTYPMVLLSGFNP